MEGKVAIHPAALVMPEMSAHDFAELKADIEKHGLLNQVLLVDGKIIDGRHRYKALLELGRELTPDDCWDVDLEDMTPGEYVWSLNGHRRHLTESQRSACFYELIGREAEEAARARQGKKQPQNIRATLPESGEGCRSRDAVARAAGVSPRTVQDVATVAKKDPELFQEVKAGNVSASAAAKKVRDKEPAKATAPVDLGPPADVAAVLRAWGKLDGSRMACLREIVMSLSLAELAVITDFVADAKTSTAGYRLEDLKDRSFAK